MRLVAFFAVIVLCSPASGQEKIALFNGADLSGWVAEGASEYKDGDQIKKVWSVKDGRIFCDGKGFGFLRYDKRKFEDFLFHVEFRLQPKCNSGIGIRTVAFDPAKSIATRPSYACYEIQIVDDAGKPANAHSTASLYRYVAPSTNAHKMAGEWNIMEIRCVGPRITITFNDQKVIDVDQTTLEAIKNKPVEGFLCLQNHGGKIEFQNLWVQVLK